MNIDKLILSFPQWKKLIESGVDIDKLLEHILNVQGAYDKYE